MARGNSSRAELVSDVIDCQYADGQMTFNAWMTVGMIVEVCVVNAADLSYLQACIPLDRAQGPAYTYVSHFIAKTTLLSQRARVRPAEERACAVQRQRLERRQRRLCRHRRHCVHG